MTCRSRSHRIASHTRREIDKSRQQTLAFKLYALTHTPFFTSKWGFDVNESEKHRLLSWTKRPLTQPWIKLGFGRNFKIVRVFVKERQWLWFNQFLAQLTCRSGYVKPRAVEHIDRTATKKLLHETKNKIQEEETKWTKNKVKIAACPNQGSANKSILCARSNFSATWIVWSSFLHTDYSIRRSQARPPFVLHVNNVESRPQREFRFQSIFPSPLLWVEISRAFNMR